MGSETAGPGIHFHRRKDDVMPANDPTKVDDNKSAPGGVAGNAGSPAGGAPSKTGGETKPDDAKNGEGKADDGKKADGKDGEDGKDGGDAQAKPMSRQKKIILIVVGVVAALVIVTAGTLYWLHARHFETTDDAYIDGHVSQISPQASGRIMSLLVDDNEQVEPGQLLAEIDPSDYNVRLAEATAQHAQAVAQLALQRANVSQAQANVEVAKADVYQADQDLKRFQSVDPKAITKQQLDNAIATDRSARAKLDANREGVGAAEAQAQTAEANVQQTQVDIDNANLQLSYTKITSPIAGRVTRRTVEVGNVVAQGTPLLAVVSNDLWITANYKETQLAHMRIGQPVRIRIDAFPDATFEGHVDSFQKGSGSVFSTLPAENATGNFVKVVQRVPVKIVFDDAHQRDQYPLAPGLSADPRVKVR